MAANGKTARGAHHGRPDVHTPGWDDADTHRFASLVLALVWPALHFATRLEDPRGFEPFWQYQLLGALYLVPAVAGGTAWGRPRVRGMFYAALFTAAAWVVLGTLHTHFAGRRVAVTAIALASALVVRDLRFVVAYATLFMGSLAALTFTLTPVLPRGIVLGRIGVGGLFALLWSWMFQREAMLQERFRSLVLASPVPTIVAAHDQCQVINEAARALFGLSPGDRLSDAVVGEVPWWVAPAGEGHAMVTMRGADGEEKRCEVSFLAVDRRRDTLHVTFVDRTLDTRFSRIKDALVATAAAELRPPLASVRAALARLASTPADDPAAGTPRDAFATAARALDRCDRVVADMPLIRALEGGGRGRVPEPRAAQDLAEQGSALVEHAAHAGGVTLAVHSEAPAGQRAMVDVERAVLALSRVLASAVRASPRGATVTLGVSSDRDGVHFRVEHAGRWTPDWMRESAVQTRPLVPLSDPGPERASGSKPGDDVLAGADLGLIVARLLAESMDGSLGHGPGAGGVGTVLTLSFQPAPHG